MPSGRRQPLLTRARLCTGQWLPTLARLPFANLGESLCLMWRVLSEFTLKDLNFAFDIFPLRFRHVLKNMSPRQIMFRAQKSKTTKVGH